MENYDFLDEDVFQGVAEGYDAYTFDNKEMDLAWEFIANTGVSVFLTGVAGTGKTTFLRRLRELTPKRMAVLAPTGVAAINAGGQTIHSFFQLPFGPFLGQNTQSKSAMFKMNQKKKDMIRTIDLLVIDEISMVRADLLDQVDDALRRFRDPSKPFGGVQLLMIGDLMQLAPVSKDAEWRLLADKYDTPYFFSSRALQQSKYVTIELKHIYRQQDKAFIDLLDHVRHGKMTQQVVDALNARYVPDISDTQAGYIRLTTHNATANAYNEQRLAALPGEAMTFQAVAKGDFPENNYPNDPILQLKPGAQVMFLKNDSSGARQYYNGKIGTVERYDEESKAIIVQCPGDEDYIAVTPDTWENVKYGIDPETKSIKEEVVGTFTQYPLRLAWAITVHKSQGLTFDHAVLDINRSFTHGQVYVALSRCRSLQGLVLSSQIWSSSVITDQSVNSFIEKEQAAIDYYIQLLPEYKSQYAVTLLDELYSMESIKQALGRLTRVVDEHLYVQEHKLLVQLKELMPQVEEQLASVGAKFAPIYRYAMAQSEGQIAGTPLEARIKSSATYFITELEHLFYVGLKGTAINVENKAIAEQYKNALISLRGEISMKIYIFEKLTTQSFSIPDYLDFKAQAWLENADNLAKSARPAKAKRKKDDIDDFLDEEVAEEELAKPKKSKKSEKEPKQPTKEQTFQLFEQGLSIEEIATQRGLTTGTIAGHLADLACMGRVELNRILAPERQQRIREAIASMTDAFTLSHIKELLPEDYEYHEIRLILDYDKKQQ